MANSLIKIAKRIKEGKFCFCTVAKKGLVRFKGLRYKTCTRILVKMLYYLLILFPFLTFWTFVLNVLWAYRYLPLNTFLLTFVVFLGGFIITYVHPGYIVAGLVEGGVEFIVTGWQLKLCDLLFHQLPFYSHLWFKTYEDIMLRDIVFTIAVLAFYIWCFNPLVVYSMCNT